jgi:branched-chain amino acid transport system permease protein
VTRRVSRQIAIVTIVALLGIALPWVGNEYFTGLGFTLVTWIALTESWIIISGMTGYVSLGHVVFVKFIVINIEAALSMSGRVLFAAPDIDGLFFMGLGLAWVSFVAAVLVRHSRFGGGLRAIRENEEAAETIGISVGLLKLTAFVLSAIVPGMVGALLIMRSTYFEPLEIFNPQTSVLIVTMAVIGGSDLPVGPLLGVVLLVLLQELLWASLPQLYMMIVGVLLISVVVWVPSGVYRQLQRLIAARAR